MSYYFIKPLQIYSINDDDLPCINETIKKKEI